MVAPRAARRHVVPHVRASRAGCSPVKCATRLAQRCLRVEDGIRCVEERCTRKKGVCASAAVLLSSGRLAEEIKLAREFCGGCSVFVRLYSFYRRDHGSVVTGEYRCEIGAESVHGWCGEDVHRKRGDCTE